jgi:uncharacterized protein (DUF58 family)
MLYPNFTDLVALKNVKSRLKLASNMSVKSTTPGDHASPLRGQGLEFDSVREYVPGDDIRNIDWRVTARMGKPHLKLFRQERERHVIICVDMNKTMRFGTKKTFKSVQAAHIAALIGWRGLAHHDLVSGCLFGDVPEGVQYFAPNRSEKSLCSMLKMMANEASLSHDISLENALQPLSQTARTGSLIYVISDFMHIKKTMHEQEVIRRLRKSCEVVFIAVNDVADTSIFPLGLLGFSTSTDKVVVDTSNHEGRKAYTAQWNQNRQYLNEVTTKLKIPLIELTTESDIHQALALKCIAKRKKQ